MYNNQQAIEQRNYYDNLGLHTFQDINTFTKLNNTIQKCNLQADIKFYNYDSSFLMSLIGESITQNVKNAIIKTFNTGTIMSIFKIINN